MLPKRSSKNSKPKAKVVKPKLKTAVPIVKEENALKPSLSSIRNRKGPEPCKSYALKSKRLPNAVRKGDEKAIEIFIAELCERER